jgi:transcriptional antiterminator Rof (Rho-off)
MTLRSGMTYSTSYQPISAPLHPNGTLDVACIHHYYSKSDGEFLEKINRRRADTIEKRSLSDVVQIHSKNNDVINTDAWDFYSRHLVHTFGHVKQH